MKNKILFFFLFTTSIIYAQEPCYKSSLNTPLGSTIEVWDWTAEQFELYLENSDVLFFPLIEDSPFYASNNSTQPNTDFLVLQSPKDFNPTNGWELLYRNFGTSLNPVDYPSFALYNRYSGKIRLFIFQYTQDLDSYQSTSIKIAYKDDTPFQSDLFGLAEMPAAATDDFSKGVELEAINHYGTYGQWMIADIQATFDPCVCDYKSSIVASLKLLSNATITLEIEGTGQSVQVAGPGGTSSNPFQSILDTAGDVTSAAQKGYKSYKDLDGFSSSLSGLVSNNSPSLGSSLASFLKPLPYVGFALPFIDLLVSSESSSPPVTFSNTYNFQASGMISEELPLSGVNLATPGSKESSAAYTPIYNNVLGVATLLETPTINFAVDSESGNDYEVYEETNYFSYKLNEDVLYAVNRLAGIKNTPKKAKGSLKFRACFSEEGYNHSYEESGLIRVSENEYRTPFMDLGCLTDYSVFLEHYEEGSINGGDIYELEGMRCDPTDIELTLALTLTQRDNPNKDIMFLATYKTNSTAAPYSYDATPDNPYLGIPENATASTIDDVFDNNIQAWGGVTITDEIVVTDEYVDLVDESLGYLFYQLVTPPNGGTPYYTIVRRETSLDTRIEPSTLSIDNSPKCGFVQPATFNQIGTFCNTKYDPMSSSFIAQTGEEDAELAEERHTDKFDLQKAAFPNPTSGKFVFQLSTNETEKLEVELTNSYGTKVQSLFSGKLPKGNHRFNFNIENQPSGIYYLMVYRSNGVETLKVIKE